jgi:CPA1 family monovalent cation:H+ antiporter
MSGAFVDLAFSGAIALIAAVLLRHFGVPMALPLIAVGAAVAVSPWGPDFLTNPEIVLVALLAPLVFGEALSSSYLDLRRVSRPVLILALGLVVATTAVIGGLGVWFAGMPLAAALALGAVLAPTDAVAVSTVAKRASLPRRLISILEGESLVNDGSGLTLLRVAVVAAIAGSVTLIEVGEIFALAVSVGVGVGALAGWLLSQVLRRSRDSVAANALVLVAPFAIYLGAEELEGSGILAVVVAALWIAHAQNSEPGASGRLQANYVWKHITFILQAVAFFSIGLELPEVIDRLPSGDLPLVPGFVAIILIALIATRFIFVFAMQGLPRLRPSNRSASNWVRGAVLVSWAGARGPVSGLAAFSIPVAISSGQSFPFRDVILATTFCVIVITLALSLTLAPLAKALKLTGEDSEQDLQRIDVQLARAALDRLDSAIEEADIAGEPFDPNVVRRLRADALARIERDEIGLKEHSLAVPPREQLMSLSLSMIHAEQAELIRIRDDEGIPDAVVRPILRELDIRAQALEVR